jgi:hypothetical protein
VLLGAFRFLDRVQAVVVVLPDVELGAGDGGGFGIGDEPVDPGRMLSPYSRSGAPET